MVFVADMVNILCILIKLDKVTAHVGRLEDDLTPFSNKKPEKPHSSPFKRFQRREGHKIFRYWTHLESHE